MFVVPSTASVPSATIDIYIDDVAWTNGTELDWGYVYPDETITANLTVQNTGDTNATVTVTCENLPSGWALTWTKNGDWCNITETLSGDLDLTVPYDASSGTYNWNTYILAEQS